MAKLTAGITGWGRGAVAGVQMQTMRGKTFIRAKQPPLGPGNANQQAYRDKFSFIQHNMKVPDGATVRPSMYWSSVPLDQRNDVLRQNLANWPFIAAANRGVFFDDFLWKSGGLTTYMYSADAGYIYIDVFTAPPNGTGYSYSLTIKTTDGNFLAFSGTIVSSGTRILEIEEQFLPYGRTLECALLTLWRYLPSSSRPYVVNSGIIYDLNGGQLRYGNFTMPQSTTPH